MNIIIFGGAFDPVHNGHINMAICASNQLNADVIFVPSKISVWKDDSVSQEHKLNMLKLAIKSFKRFKIDTFELDNSSKITFSIDTIRHLKRKYPEDNLFYLVGSDHVNVFQNWKNAKEISKLVHLIYFERPGLKIKKEMIKKFNFIKIKGKARDVSSSDIKNLKCLDIPFDVLEYIEKNNLYFIKNVFSYNQEEELKLHTLSVAKLSYQIALSNNLPNPWKAYIGGLLHDVAKRYNCQQIMETVFKDEISIGRFSFHQFVGSYLAEKDFGIIDKTILNAIKYHTTGKERMSRIGKIVYAADKIDPLRGFDSSDLIEAMKKDIDSGFIEVLRANKEFLENNRKGTNNKLTYNCFKYYL